MTRTCSKGCLIMFFLCLYVLLSTTLGEGANLLTDQQLDDLLSSIALYPDPLLAQMLPASTYPAEISDAAAWLRSGADPSSIDEQNWDESVKAIAHYPDVLDMMADNTDWTAAVGDAFLNQPDDVISSIQRLRWQARDVGNLESNDEQSVIIDVNSLEIIPAQPQYMYVPQYDPSVIYDQTWNPDMSPFITFSAGLAVGGWLGMDFDWRLHHVIYHGWARPGCVNNARPYVHVNNVYAQSSRPLINQTWRHVASHGDPDKFRASQSGVLDVYVGSRARSMDVRGRDTTPTRPPAEVFGPSGNVESFSNRGKESLDATRSRPISPTPGISQRPTPPPPVIAPRPVSPAPSRESMQPAPQPSGAFGGYRGAEEVRTQSNRGQTSRESAPAMRTAPAPAPAGGRSR